MLLINFPDKVWPKTGLAHLHKNPFVQATGFVNDHAVGCFRYEQVKQLSTTRSDR